MSDIRIFDANDDTRINSNFCDCDVNEAMKLIEQQQKRITELEQRNKELEATADRLLKACELAYDNYDKMLMTDPPQRAWKTNQVTARLFEAITSTLQHNLADRDAELIKKAMYAAAVKFGKKNTTTSEVMLYAKEYAERINRGE